MYEQYSVQYDEADCRNPAAICQTMNNTEWIPFVTIGDFHDETNGRIANLSTYVIPQFWTYEKFKDGSIQKIFYDAIECRPIFENVNDLALEKELIPLYAESKWWCPDLKEITLNNDPFTYTVGQDLNFVINFCDVAAEAKGVVDPNCETNHTLIYEYIDKCRVSHKFIRNYFIPYEYLRNGNMSYLGEIRLEIDFQPAVT